MDDIDPPRDRDAGTHDILGFVGVSTGGSSIQRVFPAWARILGLPHARLVGHDIALDAPTARFREVVGLIRDDARYAGALVTTHKIQVHRAAGDLFDTLDDFARTCGEVSSISKRGSRLVGHAKDPLTAGLSLEEFLAPGHFASTGGHALVMGAGGAGTAIAWYLSGRDDPPARIVCTDVDDAPLRHLTEVLAAGGRSGSELVTRVLPGPADTLLSGLPCGSLVVNATGMGKDRPGSPISDGAAFPRGAVAWELNYRGSLDFLHQARAAGVRCVDGWRYFIHGWSQVAAEVFDLGLTDAGIARLATAAEAVR